MAQMSGLPFLDDEAAKGAFYLERMMRVPAGPEKYLFRLSHGMGRSFVTDEPLFVLPKSGSPRRIASYGHAAAPGSR